MKKQRRSKERHMEQHDYERLHLEMLRPYLAECMVLLKKDGSFPLKQPGDLALYGNGARQTVKGGTGSGEVNSRFAVNAEEGLRAAGFHLTTQVWLDAYDGIRTEAKKNYLKSLHEKARKNHSNVLVENMGAVMLEPEYSISFRGAGETAVYILARNSGEGSDRRFEKGDISLTETEIRDILDLQRRYDRFLLVLNTGGPVDLSPVVDEVGNILILSQLGVETGSALADVLLGKYSPSGKLTTTWTAIGDYPVIGDFGGKDDTRYREGIYVGYRYFDSAGVKPLFPFGHGLSYSEFELGETTVEMDGADITLRTAVRNTGSFPGKETIEVYVSKPEDRLDHSFQELVAFGKTELLNHDEEYTEEIKCSVFDFASYDPEKACVVVEAGDYFLRLGTSSADTKPVIRIRVEEEIVIRRTQNCCGIPDFEDWKPQLECIDMFPPDVPILTVEKEKLPVLSEETHREMIEPEVEILDAATLAKLSVGAFSQKKGLFSIIGDASLHVAGAAGETCAEFEKLGVRPLVMADGPAGLRLSRDYWEEGGREVSSAASIPETVLELLPGAARWALEKLTPKKPRDAEILHHYTTALPIGTAIAQSWNTRFAELCGDIVGDEMDRMGVDLWLAPALNIHRDIRCGRNFEYYSEDPVISGNIAAAITSGVQKHPGRGVTIKHYAGNNQETNRYNSNSQISERSLREIYLRGFEICIRKAQPHALMTSYNLINGVHTSEHAGILGQILREEFGYQGIVMTDWVIAMLNSKKAKHPSANAVHVAQAGGDLFMPGSSADADSIRKAIQDGSLSIEQVKKNVSRVLRKTRELEQSACQPV